MPPTETVDDTMGSSAAGSIRREPQLVLALECDRPLGGSARVSLQSTVELVIGRGDERAIIRDDRDEALRIRLDVPAPAMSSVHARIVPAHGRWFVEDASSRNGTFLDGRRVTRAPLEDGSILELGRTLFVFRAAMPCTASAPPHEDPGARGRVGMRTLLPDLAEQMLALDRIARTKVPVLVLGESGTGKELAAREVHARSGRKGPFVALNCAALSSTLVEAQLFGHTRGAFSGALRDEPGFIRSADGGTLLLDEIGDLAEPAQAALLRVLQESEVTPVGSTKPIRVDVRIVAATHRDLTRDFRHDLRARLSGYTLTLPPLRDRIEDFGLVVADVLRAVAAERAESVRITPALGNALLAYDWPLNVRELHQVVAAAIPLAGDKRLDVAHVPAPIAALAPRKETGTTEPPPKLDDEDERLRLALIATLRENRGNVSATSRAMGKATMQIHRWMKRFGIDPATFRD